MFSSMSCEHYNYIAKFKLHATKLPKMNSNRSAARKLNVDKRRIRKQQKQVSILKEMSKEKSVQNQGPGVHWLCFFFLKELCVFVERQQKNGRSLL